MFVLVALDTRVFTALKFEFYDVEMGMGSGCHSPSVLFLAVVFKTGVTYDKHLSFRSRDTPENLRLVPILPVLGTSSTPLTYQLDARQTIFHAKNDTFPYKC